MAKRTAHINAILALSLAALSLFFLVLLLVAQFTDPVTHDEPRAHLAVTANVFIPVICVPLVALWLYIARKRCTDRTIRRYITEIAALICFFLVDTALRHPSILSSVSEITWYLYYLPMIFMPTVLFFCGLHMFRQKPTTATKAAKYATLTISSVLLLLVLTNHLHFLAFVFDPTDPAFSSSYTYGPVYWAILIWIAILLISTFILIGRSSHFDIKKALLLIGGIAGIIALYSLAYIMRVEIIFTSPLSVTYSILTLLALELFLDLKLLPSYTWQTKAFDSLPFMIAIANEEGQVSRQTKASKGVVTYQEGYVSHLRPELAEPLVATPLRHTTHTKIPDQSLSFDISHLIGGFAICAHDTSQIDEQLAKLQQTTATLTAQQQTLKAESVVQQKLRSQEEQMALYEGIEQVLGQSVATISQILDTLPADDSPEHHQARRRDLMLIKLHVAYCKRKGSLLIAATESPYMLKDKLQMVVSETSSDLGSIGIDCGALIETARPLSLQVVNLFYDLFYLFAILSLQLQDPTIMVYLSDETPASNPGSAASSARTRSAHTTDETPAQFNMRLIMEGDGMQDLNADPTQLNTLRASLSSKNVAHELTISEDDVQLTVHIPASDANNVEGASAHPSIWPQVWPPAPGAANEGAKPAHSTSTAQTAEPVAVSAPVEGGARD